MRRSLVLLSVALLAALAGRVEAAPSHATPVNSGDRVAGSLDSPSDRDLFRIAIPDGARLAVVVKATGKSPLLPDLLLLDPSGAPVDVLKYLAGRATDRVEIPILGIHETGTWTVGVSSYGGTTGAYQAVFRVERDAKVRATITVAAGATVQQHFVGVDGARVDYTIVERSGPALERAGICCPRDNPIPGTEASRKGNRLSARKVVLGQGGGLYGLEMTGSSLGPTTVDVTAAVRFPKVKAARVRLGEEPRPSSLSPTIGCNGTPFVLKGTGFREGAKVAFADADEAVDVQWISETEIRGRTPECAASRAGEQAPVSVFNPDGQYGTAPVRFAFIGIPAPAGFSPNLSPLEGGVDVSVSGERFREGFTVEVDGIPAPSVEYVSPSFLRFRTPAAPAGVHGIVLRDEYGRPSSSLSGLWYSDSPEVESADPSELSSLGGATIHLVGEGMVDGVRVFVDGNEGVVLTREPPVRLSFLCPPGRAGAVELEVRDSLGRSFRGDLLTMTRALHDASAASLPQRPEGADFRGDLVNLADLGGDGRPEILVTSRAKWSSPVNGQPMPGSFLLGNLGDGTFIDATSGALPSFGQPGDDGQGDAALLGDMDGDGMADAVLVRAAPLPAAPPYGWYGNYKSYYAAYGTTDPDPRTAVATRFLRNDGTGRLSDATDASAPAPESTPAFGRGERWQGGAASLGDLDGDGAADLVLLAADDVDRGTVSGMQWAYRYRYYMGYKYKYRDKAFFGQAVEDGNSLRVLRNDGAGAFSHDAALDPVPVTLADGTVLDDFRGAATALGDLNGDGTLDLVVLGADRSFRDDGQGGAKPASALRVLFNDGSGSFAFAPGSVPEPLGTSKPDSYEWWQGTSLVLADLDGDGDLDIAVGRETVRTWTDPASGKVQVFPALRLFRNLGGTTFAEDTAGLLSADLTTKPTASTLLGVRSMAAADMDGDGDADLLVTGRVTMSTDSAIPGGARMATRVLLDRDGILVDATADWLAPGDFLPGDGLAIGDLDGDGQNDLTLVQQGDPGEGKRSLRILFGR